MIRNFVKDCINNGSDLKPLLVEAKDMINPSLMNPSILTLPNNKVIVNLRNVNYLLYHAENSLNEHSWGPLCYLHPENQIELATHNILCSLNDNYDIERYSNVDTSTLDVKPLWEFVGLEDARLAYWDDKLFLCGVRRDTTTNGQGRMELSEIVEENNVYKEISRARIPAPPDNTSYCEKNWMPILDLPYHFIKWTNETEVVRYNPSDQTCNTVHLGKFQDFGTGDLRGGSQVIKIQNKYLALAHETNLYNSEAGRKNADYYHRFVVWDENFNLIKVSKRFNFMNAKIEFSCGLCVHNDRMLITFGYQDNASYLLNAPLPFILQFINE